VFLLETSLLRKSFLIRKEAEFEPSCLVVSLGLAAARFRLRDSLNAKHEEAKLTRTRPNLDIFKN
jgi:hypothetical protein